jgi:plastocyanin
MKTTRRTPHLAAAAVAALALAGCGSSSSTSKSAPTTSTAAPAAQGGAGAYGAGGTSGSSAAGAVKLSADPGGALRFNVSTLHAKAGSVTLEMANPASSHVPHGVAVQGNGVDKDSKIVPSGATATLTVTLKPGTYSFYCPVQGHEAAGMKGTLIVT